MAPSTSAKPIKLPSSLSSASSSGPTLVQEGQLPDPTAFIHSIPHMSFVWGEANVEYLRKRHAALLHSPLFQGMEFSTDPQQIAAWIPLVMDGRDPAQPVAATRMAVGTDVNFGTLTRSLFTYLKDQPGVDFHLGHEVEELQAQARRHLAAENPQPGHRRESACARARFVFIGAGGGSLPLLEKSGIPEANGFGGFPVSGQWLKCQNPEVIARHEAKVYGKPAVGSPPMSMPHLDTRQINGRKELLFGPYAGFSTKFLKKGSYTDLFRSIELGNIRPLLYAGARNLGLTSYLIGQVLQTPAGAHRRPARVLPRSQPRRLAAGSGRPARAGHQKRQEAGRRAGIRHRDGDLGRRLHCRAAGRFAGRQHGRGHHARPGAEVLPRTRRLARVAGPVPAAGAFLRPARWPTTRPWPPPCASTAARCCSWRHKQAASSRLCC